MTADPAATPVTEPEVLTVATASSLEDQLTGRPKRLPDSSRVAALSCSVSPTSIEPLVGLTVTLATVGGPDGESEPEQAMTTVRAIGVSQRCNFMSFVLGGANPSYSAVRKIGGGRLA